MTTINFKNFSLDLLQGILTDIKILNINDFNRKVNYTISDYIDFHVHNGEENLYFDLLIYPIDGFDPLILKIFTKDNHQDLKNLISHLIMLWFIIAWLKLHLKNMLLPIINKPVIAVCKRGNGEIENFEIKRIQSALFLEGWNWSDIHYNTYFTLEVLSWEYLSNKKSYELS